MRISSAGILVMIKLQNLWLFSDAGCITFRVAANRLSDYKEDPLTSDFFNESTACLFELIYGICILIYMLSFRK